MFYMYMDARNLFTFVLQIKAKQINWIGMKFEGLSVVFDFDQFENQQS